MARVFVSSTFQDLKEYRQAVYVALRRLGHQSVAMEDYAATDRPPLERSLERGILAPALIEQTKIPLRFRRIQAADLVGWSPDAPDTQGMQALISAIGRCVRGNARGPA